MQNLNSKQNGAVYMPCLITCKSTEIRASSVPKEVAVGGSSVKRDRLLVLPLSVPLLSPPEALKDAAGSAERGAALETAPSGR